MYEYDELHFSNVLLLPKYSEVKSRSEVSTSQRLGSRTFVMPIIPANMKTVVDLDMAIYFAKHNLFYVMHRFGDTLEFCERMADEEKYISISVGVNEDSQKLIMDLSKRRSQVKPHYVTIDIAHGHCLKMKNMIKFIKKEIPYVFLIAGNVCTREATDDLTEWGADAIKVGIASGSVCVTKFQTGFSRPQFSAVLDCAKNATVPIISDGGIEHNGDIAKALVAGAHFVMVGRGLAGFEESPGRKVIHDDGRITKEYYGSASEHNKGMKEYVEGCRIEIPYRGSIADKIKELRQSLSSSISYAGGHDLTAFKSVDWVQNPTF